MTSLRALRADEFDEWYARSRAGYADDIERNAGLRREDARRKATADFARLFPDGFGSRGQSVFHVVDGDTTVGSVWLAEIERHGRRHAYVYEVRIDEPMRGRGLGRRAMELAEEEARRRGLARIELNVFGGNDVARGLYRSLGYAEVAVSMGKDL